LLGRGHAGLLFRAHHRQNNQAVTVKVLSPEFPKTDAEQACFARALKAVAPLRHPHLVSVLAAGKTGPFCWIAREYVEGESLATLIARLHAEGKLGWKRACRVAVHLGKVLDFLHQRGMTHGNLTPANVLVRTDTKTTLLADLMLDKALEGSELADLIREKKLLAELPYYAPEQLDVDAPLDHRTSLYALGTLLYALLTGHPPFTGTEPETIVGLILEGKLVRPSKFLRDTPPPFDAAVVKLLAHRPEDRYQTAAELLAVVEPIANFNEIKV
jgi:serine/threonine-protein kinase